MCSSYMLMFPLKGDQAISHIWYCLPGKPNRASTSSQVFPQNAPNFEPKGGHYTQSEL